jgi:hypothetical protein
MSATFAASNFPSLALAFFGLVTGYLIWGPKELFGFPRRDERVDRSLGGWGVASSWLSARRSSNGYSA